MRLSTPARFITYSLLTLVLISTMTAVAATNVVPFTRITNRSEVIGMNSLKPSACAGMALTNIVSGSGTLIGTTDNDLILGSSSVDVIDGLSGNDCIVGGGGDDQITGGDGNDVCLSGDGYDVFTGCEVEQ